jgi:hypothetical protein
LLELVFQVVEVGLAGNARDRVGHRPGLAEELVDRPTKFRFGLPALPLLLPVGRVGESSEVLPQRAHRVSVPLLTLGFLPGANLGGR